MPTPKLTPLPIPSGPDSRSSANSKPSPGYLNSDSKGGGTGSPVPPLNNPGKENGGDGVYARGTVEELLHSLRPSISPLEEIERDQYIDADLNRREKNRNGSGGEPHDDEAN
jgi:hypothetical protein